jgi:hypothetical protein
LNICLNALYVLWMKRALNYLKNLVPWDKSPDFRKYDVAIGLLSIFLIIYTIYYTSGIQKRISDSKPTVIKIELAKITTNDIVVATNHSLTIDTKVKVEYEVGEIVGVKHLGIIGIVVEKTLSFGGYKYEIIYRDTSGAVQKSSIDAWLLYHPQREQISPFFLLN